MNDSTRTGARGSAMVRTIQGVLKPSAVPEQANADMFSSTLWFNIVTSR